MKAPLRTVLLTAPLAAAALLFLPNVDPVAGQAPEIEVQDVKDGLHVLVGSGGNVLLCVGEDGAFLVDDKFSRDYGIIRSAVAERSDTPAQFVINTHFHGDHTGSNDLFSNDGAILVAHDNVRARMSKPRDRGAGNAPDPARASEALPTITYADGMTLHRNGHTVNLIHVPHAHTDGDTLVHFVEADLIHTGDVVFNGFYPFIDGFSGGSLRGTAAAAEKVIAMMGPDTIVVPGHGALATKADLEAYRDMLNGVADAIEPLKQAGKSLDEVIEAQPTAAFDEAWGGGFLSVERFVEVAYDAL